MNSTVFMMNDTERDDHHLEIQILIKYVKDETLPLFVRDENIFSCGTVRYLRINTNNLD